MVVDGQGNDAHNDVEVLNLKNPQSVCAKPGDVPRRYLPTGDFMAGTTPLVCGGFIEGTGCYVYDNSSGMKMVFIDGFIQ